MTGASFVALTLFACHAFAGPKVTAPKSAAKTVAAPLPHTLELIHGPVPARVDVVSPSKLCTTEGRVVPNGNLMHVDAGAMRGFLSTDRSRSEEVTFTYRGPSKETAPLGNGEIRRQLGIKLKAQDTCNVVYAMWHIEPTPGIHVSVKRNPGKSTFDACKDGGYINVTPTMTKPVPAVVPGAPHSMRADLDGLKLRVLVDGALVWEATLPPQAGEIDGPPGIRSDNGTFDFKLHVPSGAASAPPCQ